MDMKKYMYLFLLCLWFPAKAISQLNAGFQLQYAQALGELKEESYRNGGGLNLDILYGEFGTSLPIVFQTGIQADFNFHGQESESVTLNTGETAEISIRNQNAGIFGTIRALSPYSPVRVYLDGLIGTRFFFSQDVFMLEGAEDSDIEGITNTWAFSYGGAIGLLVQINDELSIDARLKYTQGSWAEYVDLETVELVNDEFIYDFQRSTTQLLTFQLGISLYLSEIL